MSIFKVLTVDLKNHTDIVYSGTDIDTALTVYVLQSRAKTSAEFIEIYRNGKLYRSTIGRNIV